MVKRLLAFLIVMGATRVVAQNAVAIRAGGVVDPLKGSVTKNQVILVENGKIKEIGANVVIPQGAITIDLSKEWVTPGLMDAHVHLTLTEVTGGNAPFESFYLKESSTYRGLRGLRNAQDLLRAGFTTVREVGNDGNYATEDVRRAIQAGMFDGPSSGPNWQTMRAKQLTKRLRRAWMRIPDPTRMSKRTITMRLPAQPFS